MRRPRIIVVGSINMDLVYRTHQLPRPGETISGHSFRQIPGGKGANQAVAAARLGADVSMVGRVGDDGFGTLLINGLVQEKINVQHVTVTRNTSSGLAVIGVEDSGQNSIAVIPGANSLVTPDDVLAAKAIFESADVLLLQFEIPLPAIQQAITLGRQHGLKVILDPAPACAEVPREILQVDITCPNETEAGALSGFPVHSISDAVVAAQRICEMGIPLSIVTLGSQGAVVCDGTLCQKIPPFAVQTIDSTAAGDAFAAALGMAIAEKHRPFDAVRFACAAGAIAASQPGAQPSMPTRTAVESLIANSA